LIQYIATNELILFGDLLLPSSLMIPEISTTAAAAAATATCYPALTILTNQAVNALKTTRQINGNGSVNCT
jgi:hypothetical protein